MPIFLVLVVFVLLMFMLKKINRLYVMDRMVAALPSPPSKPVIGHLAMFCIPKAIDFNRKALDLSFEYSRSFKLWIGPLLGVIIQDKGHIQAVLERVDKAIVYETLPTFVHNGLLMAKGE